jgi:hypothetical protein
VELGGLQKLCEFDPVVYIVEPDRLIKGMLPQPWGLVPAAHLDEGIEDKALLHLVGRGVERHVFRWVTNARTARRELEERKGSLDNINHIPEREYWLNFGRVLGNRFSVCSHG